MTYPLELSEYFCGRTLLFGTHNACYLKNIIPLEIKFSLSRYLKYYPISFRNLFVSKLNTCLHFKPFHLELNLIFVVISFSVNYNCLFRLFIFLKFRDFVVALF